MKHIKNINYFLSFMAIILLAGCSVNEINEGTLSEEVFWNGEASLKGAVLNLYNDDADGNYQIDYEAMSDNAFTTNGDWNGVSSGNRQIPATDGNYSGAYSAIRRCNLVLTNLYRFEGKIDEAARQNYGAQARFFRALSYFKLVRRFGQVPIVDQVLTDQSSELYGKQASREELFNLIYSDLDEAIKYLPEYNTLGAAGYGLVSKNAAYFLKARVALFEGTRSKYFNYGTPNTHLQIAKDASLRIIQSGQHKLDPDFKNHFLEVNDGYKAGQTENIFVWVLGIDYSNSKNATRYPEGIKNLSMVPTRSLADAFLATDGLPINMSKVYKTPTTPGAEFTNRDLRMAGTIRKQGDPINEEIQLTVGVDRNLYNDSIFHVSSGYSFLKFYTAEHWQGSLIDNPKFRYAEMLLTYAEATYELNGSISDADLNLSINLLRARGGITPLTNAFIAANPPLTMLGEIRRERRVELAQEGQRWWDLMRWKTAEVELPKAQEGRFIYNIYKTYSASIIAPLILTADNHVIMQQASQRKFTAPRDYLFPFPNYELSLAGNQIVQNTGW